MRLAFLSIVATRALQLAPQRQQRRLSHSSKQLDDVDADFRRLLATGLTPTDAFTPVDVAALTLRALRSGDERFLHRFSTPEFARSRAEVKLRDAFRTNPPDSLVDIHTGTSGRQTPRVDVRRPQQRPVCDTPRRVHRRPRRRCSCTGRRGILTSAPRRRIRRPRHSRVGTQITTGLLAHESVALARLSARVPPRHRRRGMDTDMRLTASLRHRDRKKTRKARHCMYVTNYPSKALKTRAPSQRSAARRSSHRAPSPRR